MKALPEQYRMPVLAAGILILALVIAALAGQKATAPGNEAMPAGSSTGTTMQAAPTSTATTTKTAPAKKPATAPKTAPQSATNPAAIGQTPAFVTDQLKLSIMVSQYGAELSWSPSLSKIVTAYVVVKSTTDSNPYYPKEAWSMYRNSTTGNYTWEDRSLEKGKLTFYRTCALLSDETVQCGNVATALKP